MEDDFVDDDWIEEDDDEDDLLICPNCRSEVHEDTQQCPHCGDWIIPIYPSETSKKMIWIIAVVLMITSMIMISLL